MKRVKLNGAADLEEKLKQTGEPLVQTLITLRKQVTRKDVKSFRISRCNFQLLASLLRKFNTDHQILSLSLSIIGNLCTQDAYKKWFFEEDGYLQNISNLIVILRTIDSNDVLCRGWRLCGSLIASERINTLAQMQLHEVMAEHLSNIIKYKRGTRTMICRALQHWCVSLPSHRKFDLQLEDAVLLVLSSADVENFDEIIKCILYILSLIPNKLSSWEKRTALMEHLINLSKCDKYKDDCIKIFLKIVNQKLLFSDVIGTRIADLIADYILTNSNPDDAFNVNTIELLQAIFNLTKESCLRNKFRHNGLVPKYLLQHYLFKDNCNANCTELIIDILHNFRQDEYVFMILARDTKFLRVILSSLEQISRAKDILKVILHLYQSCKGRQLASSLEVLIKDELIDWHLGRQDQFQLVKFLLTRHEMFFKKLLMGGKFWHIALVCNPVRAYLNISYALDVIRQMLNKPTNESRECFPTIAMAIPFLLNPSDKQSLYQFLVRFGCFEMILQVFEGENSNANAANNGVFETMVTLIQLFEESSGIALIEVVSGQDEITKREKIVDDMDVDFKTINDALITNSDCSYNEVEEVTLVFNDGLKIKESKRKLAELSPVFEAMLRAGSFKEGNQKEVSLQAYSSKAFQAFMNLIQKSDISCVDELSTSTWLEVITIADHYLFVDLSVILARRIPIKKDSFVEIYLAARECSPAACSTRHDILRYRVFRYLFSKVDEAKQVFRGLVDDRKVYDMLICDILFFATSYYNKLSPVTV